MEVGQLIFRHPITCMAYPDRYDMAEPMIGKIVYIHPQGRYHTVEFYCDGYTFRECFSQYDLVPGDTYYTPGRCYNPNDWEEELAQ